MADLPKWKKRADVDGTFWEIDVLLGSGALRIMVNKGDVKPGVWGYTIADGGCATIADADRFNSMREAKIDALATLSAKLRDVFSVIARLREDLAIGKVRK